MYLFCKLIIIYSFKPCNLNINQVMSIKLLLFIYLICPVTRGYTMLEKHETKELENTKEKNNKTKLYKTQKQNYGDAENHGLKDGEDLTKTERN